jgi:hypothetical protein
VEQDLLVEVVLLATVEVVEPLGIQEPQEILGI